MSKEDVAHIEREAVKLFLLSAEKEFNAKFRMFSMVVDCSGRLPQLHIREEGKL